jgi:hypothetical protein
LVVNSSTAATGQGKFPHLHQPFGCAIHPANTPAEVGVNRLCQLDES